MNRFLEWPLRWVWDINWCWWPGWWSKKKCRSRWDSLGFASRMLRNFQLWWLQLFKKGEIKWQTSYDYSTFGKFWNGFNFCQINTMKWWFISPTCSHVFFYMLKSLFLMSYRGSICLSFQYGLYPEYGNMIDYDGTILWWLVYPCSGKLSVCYSSHGPFSALLYPHKKWWCSTVMLVYPCYTHSICCFGPEAKASDIAA